jgi:hypothetical protein
MIFDSKNQDSLSLVILIPHVSRLLIYKDNWNKSLVMRKVIAAILKSGTFSKLYLGSKPENYCNHYNPDCFDCAIINLRISGLHLLDYEVATAEQLFARELENKSNMLHFDNTLLNVENNVSCIEVSIKIAESRKKSNDEIQAA